MGGVPGNRQENRGRGNAPQMLEKYKALARDAQQAGDRVQTEYYLQFADHYFRVVSETRSRYEEPRRVREDAEEYDEDGADYGAEEETETVRADRPQRDGREREDRPGRDRDDRPREMAREDRGQRDDRPRDRDDRPREMAREDRPARADRPRRYRDEERAPAFSGRVNGHDAADEEAPGLDLDRLPPAIARPVLSDGDAEDVRADGGTETGAEREAADREEGGDDRPRRTRRPRRPREGAPVAA